MGLNKSEKRMAQNEVLFRKMNEQIQKNLDSLTKLATEEGHNTEKLTPRLPIHFYCECADENCHERIKIELNEYNKIHKFRNRFIILPNHEVSQIEKIITKHKSYWVVAKNFTPDVPESFNSTRLHNV